MCSASVPAWGQTDEQRASARSLATEGASAFREGRFKEAAEFFSKAESLVHAPPHLLFLARAYTKLGQFVKAREAYLKITRETLEPKAPPAFREAQTAASNELSTLEPKIAGLTVKVQGGESAKDLTVRIDDVTMSNVLIGARQPIDPGEHKIDATATGLRAQPFKVKLLDGESSVVILKLEVDASAQTGAASAVAASPTSAPSATSASAADASPVADSGAPHGSSNSMRTGAYVALGVGALGLGIGTVFLLKSQSKHSQADEICSLPGPRPCPLSRQAEVDQLDSDGKSAATIGIVGLVVGGIGAAAGVGLLVASGSKGGDAKSASAPGIEPWIGLHSAGVSGRF